MRYITTTKNLFDKSVFSPVGDVANATLIEVKENGWIVQGNLSSTPGTGLYNNGWFRPGATRYDSNIGMLLDKAGKVTVSAYYTVLENNSISTANIYLYGTRQKVATHFDMLPDVGIKTRIYTTYDINEGEEGIYYPVFTLNSSKILIEDIQIEYGDTPTDYVPYGYLPMYKGRYKVSDYCQLLDKSKYPATQTINGVTFTNNGDGSITANGTATKATNLLFCLDVPYPKNHITLIIGCPSDGTGNTYYMTTTFGNDYGKGLIKKQDKNFRTGNCYISITANTVCSNIIFKPQLFDLTEMFGAGNEPTTVAEFREKFPNELYPYSPYCWVKMKQMRYKVSDVCQLLDKSKYPSVITNAGVTTTSNGDGSITINGTATKSYYINCTPQYPKENNGHVFYVCANNTTMSKSTWSYGLLHQESSYDYGSGVISKTNASKGRYTGIVFNKGVVFDNVIIKPQIIDLTEMYGAGNEPTTVEEFREKFPDELYPYSPKCYLPLK